MRVCLVRWRAADLLSSKPRVAAHSPARSAIKSGVGSTPGLLSCSNDLAFLSQYGAQEVIFMDPTFNVQRLRTLQLLRFIPRELPRFPLHAEVKTYARLKAAACQKRRIDRRYIPKLGIRGQTHQIANVRNSGAGYVCNTHLSIVHLAGSDPSRLHRRK